MYGFFYEFVIQKYFLLQKLLNENLLDNSFFFLTKIINTNFNEINLFLQSKVLLMKSFSISTLKNNFTFAL